MKLLHSLTSKRRLLSLLGAGLITSTIAIQGVSGIVTAAGNDIIYLAPATTTRFAGETFDLEIRANSNAEQVNAVQVELAYPQDKLQFESFDASGSAYTVDAQKTAGNGKVVVVRGHTAPLTGDRLIMKVKFRTTATGTAAISVTNQSVLLSHANNQNIADTRSGGSYTINAPGSGSPTPPRPGPPGPPGPTGPAGRPQPVPTTRPVPRPATGSSPNVTVTPNPTSTSPNPSPTILPDDSEFEVEEPSTIETTPSNDDEVEKVEYYINGKLAMTVNEPPFSYSVDSTNMRNGKYTLTTKTYYKDGRIDSTDAALVVKNPFSAKQLMLQLRHYAWLIILLLLIIGGLVWFMFFRNKGGGDDFGDGYGSDYSSGGYDPYAVPPATSDPTLDPNAMPPMPPTDPNSNPGGNPNDPYGRY